MKIGQITDGGHGQPPHSLPPITRHTTPAAQRLQLCRHPFNIHDYSRQPKEVTQRSQLSSACTGRTSSHLASHHIHNKLGLSPLELHTPQQQHAVLLLRKPNTTAES